MWQMLRVYGVGGKLLKAVQSFYVDCRTFVRVGNDVSEWFPVNVGLRQGCVMSPWLFNVYVDGVVREVNVRVLGKGLELLSANGGRFQITQLLFADDTALVADSAEKLCRLVPEFGSVCERRKLRLNVGKSKVMRCSRPCILLDRSPVLWWLSPGEGWDAVTLCGWDKLKRAYY